MVKNKSFKNFKPSKLIDNEELMLNTRKLMKKKEALEQELVTLKEECDAMQTILCSTTSEEISELLDQFFPNNILEEKRSFLDNDNLQIYIEAKNKCSINRFFGIIARQTDKEEIIIEYISPHNYVPPTPALLKFAFNDRMFILKHAVLPPVIPINKLKEKYLSVEQMDIHTFIFTIHKYLWSYWIRDEEVQKVKKGEYLKDSSIYFNRDRTLITFSLFLLDKYKVEVCLKYDPYLTRPKQVTYTEQDDKILPRDARKVLNELQENLMTNSLSKVIEDHLGPSESASVASESEDSQSTVVFELFKR